MFTQPSRPTRSLWLPFCSHIAHLFGLNYALLFLNNSPACCSVSPGGATLDSISGPRQANLGQSCRRFLNAHSEWLPDCVHARKCVCACLYEWLCTSPPPKASVLLPVHPEPKHISLRSLCSSVFRRNSNELCGLIPVASSRASICQNAESGGGLSRGRTDRGAEPC